MSNSVTTYSVERSGRGVASPLAVKSEELADSLARGAARLSTVFEQPTAKRLTRDAAVLIGSTEISRQVVNGLRMMPGESVFRVYKNLQLPLLRYAGGFVDGISGSSNLLNTFAKERLAGSKFYPKSLLSSVGSVAQIIGSVSAAKVAAGATAAAAGAVLTGVGVSAAATGLLAGGAAIGAAALTAYGVGKVIGMLHQHVGKLL